MSLKFIHLKNEAGLEVILCPLGASIYGIRFHGEWMTMTPVKEEDFARPEIYQGKTIGRTANRIEGSLVKIDGKEYRLEANENGNTLHGGAHPLSARTFMYEKEEDEHEIRAVFQTVSPDGESGFPGNLSVKVIYRLMKKEATLYIEFEAESDKPTLCNLTNHAYFTLGESDLSNLSLNLGASTYIKTREEDLIPIEIAPIDEALDFRVPKLLLKDIAQVDKGKAKGYDHAFVFKPEDQKILSLSSPRFQMTVETEFKAVQIYTDNYPDGVAYHGTSLERRRGVAIEMQDDFSKRETLYPETRYSRVIAYHFAQLHA